MKTGYKVCDAMTRKPIVVSSISTIEQCAKMMNTENVGSLLIKDKEKLLGIITDQDIVRRIIAKGIDPKVTLVKKHMSAIKYTASPEEDIFEALNTMTETNVKQLPVLDGKKMVGLLTQKDVLKIEPELFDLLVDKLEVREGDRKPIGSEGLCEECGSYAKKLTARKGAMICVECRN